MKRISPDITDDAKVILDQLCQDRRQTMGAALSQLILESAAKDALAEQLLAHLQSIETKVALLCKVVLEPVETGPPPVQTDAERYGADFVQPMPDLPVPEPPRRGMLHRLLFTGG